MGIGAPGQNDHGDLDAQSTRPHPQNGRVPWTVVIPLKPPAQGKTRLGSDAALARAIALDTVEAAARAIQVSRLIVVTADDELAEAAKNVFRFGDVVIESEPRGLGPRTTALLATP